MQDEQPVTPQGHTPNDCTRQGTWKNPRDGTLAGLESISTWEVRTARRIAGALLAGTGSRWEHVQGVGGLAEECHRAGLVSNVVVVAAWLHDIGYAEPIATTGFHPLDGAVALADLGAPREVVGLVGHHTECQFEAAERGLSAELAKVPMPTEAHLDWVTYIDLCVGPTGQRVTPQERVKEILHRYPSEHPVHQAISAATDALLARAERVEKQIEAAGMPLRGGRTG